MVGGVIAYACLPSCESEPAHWPHWGCAIVSMVSMIGEAVLDVIHIIDQGWTINTDYCGVFYDMKDSFEFEEDE